MDAELSGLPDHPLDEGAMVRAIQRLPATRFGLGPPDTTFADWVAARAGPHSELRWFVEGCGHNGPPVNLGGTNDEWAYVTASFEEPTVRVLIQIRVGTCRKGPLGAPAVTRVSVFDKRPGHIHVERTTLGELPGILREIRR